MEIVISEHEMRDVSVAFHLALVLLAERENDLLVRTRIKSVLINRFNKRNGSAILVFSSEIEVSLSSCFGASTPATLADPFFAEPVSVFA